MSEQTSDPFATGAPGVEDDPFADTPPADLAAEVEAEPAAAPPEADIPTVDREGAPVAPAATEPSEREAEVNPPDAPAGPPPAEEPPAPAPEPTPEPQAAPPAPEPQPAPTPEPPAAPAPAAAAPAADEGGEDAAEGDSDKPKGKPRHYKVFYMTATKQWTEYDLGSNLPEGVKVVKDEDELWYEARNNDHATRIAYAILGSPADGVMLWPVPKGAYKPKRVKPAPPAPERTRLVIS